MMGLIWIASPCTARDGDTDQRILDIKVRGKRGVGSCKSMPGAVQPYHRLLKRPAADSDIWLKDDPDHQKKPPKYPEPTDLLFPSNHIKMFNGVLRRTKLKLDREGNKRTAYSLRHTYICMRLIEGTDIYALAKNCRTAVDVIEWGMINGKRSGGCWVTNGICWIHDKEPAFQRSLCQSVLHFLNKR
jgi:integrase